MGWNEGMTKDYLAGVDQGKKDKATGAWNPIPYGREFPKCYAQGYHHGQGVKEEPEIMRRED